MTIKTFLSMPTVVNHVVYEGRQSSRESCEGGLGREREVSGDSWREGVVGWGAEEGAGVQSKPTFIVSRKGFASSS